MSDIVVESEVVACVSNDTIMKISWLQYLSSLGHLEHLLLDLDLSLERVDLLLAQRPPVGRRPPPTRRRRRRGSRRGSRRPLLELVLQDLLLDVALGKQLRLERI